MVADEPTKDSDDEEEEVVDSEEVDKDEPMELGSCSDWIILLSL